MRAEKGAAALDVYAGHMSEPDALPGLAHFLEHLLFMGTERYPLENEYHAFLSEHGGMSNAYTSADHTVYFFDVAAAHFDAAVDRFAQFFIAPLFSANATEKELNAVNSEHEKNVKSDAWRNFQLEKFTSRPGHPFAKFGTGNHETLATRPEAAGVNVREALLKFHEDFYSSNLMTLSLVGPYSLDVLTELVTSKFSAVKNKKLAIPRFDTHPYGPEQVGEQLYVVPVKDLRYLQLLFPLPSQLEHSASHPTSYMSHLIGHEGTNSILSYLKECALANGLSAGLVNSHNGFSFFSIHIELTEKGLTATDDVVMAVFQYIAMMRARGPQEHIFQECKALGDLAFRFKDRQPPMGAASAIANNLHLYAPSRVLSGHDTYAAFDPVLISTLTDLLTPQNLRLILTSQTLENVADQTLEFYGARYKRERIPEAKLKAWSLATCHPQLQLPLPNDFVPTDFELRARPNEPQPFPVIIQDSALSRVWHKQDAEFLLPKTWVSFQLTSPLSYVDPLHAVLSRLFCDLLRDALNEFAYHAEIAGLDYAIVTDFCGLIIRVDGYSHQLPLLVERIFDRLGSFKTNANRFEEVKDAYTRELKNFSAEQPSSQVTYLSSFLLSERIWNHEQKLAELEHVTLERLDAFVPQLLSRIHLESLIVGNITAEQANALSDTVVAALKRHQNVSSLLPMERLKGRCHVVPKGKTFLYSSQNAIRDISAVENYYQIGLEEVPKNATLSLLCQILAEPCFNQLRTKEQLGYIVGSGIKHQYGVHGARVVVQSSRHPTFVDHRIEAFLLHFGKLLQSMPQEDFNAHVEATIAKKLVKDKSLRQAATRAWAEIAAQMYNFNRVDQEVAVLRAITQSELIGFFERHFSSASPLRRKVSTQVVGTAAAGMAPDAVVAEIAKDVADSADPSLVPSPQLATPPIHIQDVVAFKRTMSLYPLKFEPLSSKL
ncbi:insulin degrading enzyme, variant 1 [Capsaspora owczarzaki ATCC 30864]|nr:insulin degrading enzyme, variant 1 [Capsaspora owczarzaki ATCC 30864]